MENNNSFCPKCGAPIANGVQFCSHCGAALIQPNAPQMQGEPTYNAPVPEPVSPGFRWNWGKGLHGILCIAFPLVFAFLALYMAKQAGAGDAGFFDYLTVMFGFMMMSVFFYGFTRCTDLIRFIRTNKTTSAISGFVGGLVKFLTIIYTLAAGLPILGLILGLALFLWVVILAGPVFWVLDLIGFIRARLASRRTAA